MSNLTHLSADHHEVVVGFGPTNIPLIVHTLIHDENGLGLEKYPVLGVATVHTLDKVTGKVIDSEFVPAVLDTNSMGAIAPWPYVMGTNEKLVDICPVDREFDRGFLWSQIQDAGLAHGKPVSTELMNKLVEDEEVSW